MVELTRRARAAHPGVEVPDRELEAALDAASGRGAPADESAEDIYLALGVARGEVKALETLDQLLAGLEPAIRRVEPDDAFVAEVRQLVRIKLVVGDGRRPPRITQYRGAGPLSKWLRAVALNVALRAKAQRGRHESDRSTARLAAKLDSADVKLLRLRHQRDFDAAFAKALRRLTPRERSVLRLRHVDGLSLEQIAAWLHVDRSTAVRSLSAMKDRLTRETREELADSLELQPAEIDSLIRAMGSDFRVSVGRLLDEVEGGHRKK